MKKIILIILILNSSLIYSQYNYIKNKGFNALINPNSNSNTLQYYIGGFPYSPCGYGKVDECIDWHTRTKGYLCSTCGASAVFEHSPDLYSVFCGISNNHIVNIFKGENSIGVGSNNKEMIQQTMNRGLWPGKYMFSGFLKPDQIGYSNAIDHTLSIHFNDSELEFDCEDDCSDFQNNEDCYYEFDSDPEYSYDFKYDNTCKNRSNQISFHNFNFEFQGNFDELDKFAFLYHGDDKNEKYSCDYPGRYIYLDEISLQRKSCFCPDYLWLENNNYNDEKIQANLNLRFGYNVENVSQNGNIDFFENNEITAGQSITLEPGTTVWGGSNSFKIQPCTFKTGTPIFLSISNAALQNSSNPLNSYWHIYTSNATDYFLQLFNQWGELDREYIGEFDNNGRALVYPPYDLDIDQFVFVLDIFNCDGTKTTYNAGTLNMLKSTNNLVENKISIYPNPTSDFISVRNNFKEIEDFEYTIRDLTGKIIVSQFVKNTKLNNFKLDLTLLNSGIYFIQINTESQIVLKEKIVKND